MEYRASRVTWRAYFQNIPWHQVRAHRFEINSKFTSDKIDNRKTPMPQHTNHTEWKTTAFERKSLARAFPRMTWICYDFHHSLGKPKTDIAFSARRAIVWKCPFSIPLNPPRPSTTHSCFPSIHSSSSSTMYRRRRQDVCLSHFILFFIYNYNKWSFTFTLIFTIDR